MKLGLKGGTSVQGETRAVLSRNAAGAHVPAGITFSKELYVWVWSIYRWVLITFKQGDNRGVRKKNSASLFDKI